MYKTVPPAMLNRVFFFHLCNTTMKAMAISSGRQWSREKNGLLQAIYHQHADDGAGQDGSQVGNEFRRSFPLRKDEKSGEPCDLGPQSNNGDRYGVWKS